MPPKFPNICPLLGIGLVRRGEVLIDSLLESGAKVPEMPLGLEATAPGPGRGFVQQSEDTANKKARLATGLEGRKP
jgi:hypothetical protein